MENKENLLTCARDLFYARGYDAVGIQEIVDAAGVTKPTMYYYFGSKKGLLEELMRRIFDELQGQMEQAATRREEDRFPDILYRVVDTFLHYATSHEKEYRFALALYYTGEENEGHLVVKPLIGRYYSCLVQIFAEAADGLVGRVVDDFCHDMQRVFRTRIHAGTLPDRFKPFQYLD